MQACCDRGAANTGGIVQSIKLHRGGPMFWMKRSIFKDIMYVHIWGKKQQKEQSADTLAVKWALKQKRMQGPDTGQYRKEMETGLTYSGVNSTHHIT